MKETKKYGLWALVALGLIALVVGFMVAVMVMPVKTVTVTKEVTKEVPVTVEVVKEVSTPVLDLTLAQEAVVDKVKASLSDDKSLRKCGGEVYSSDDITVEARSPVVFVTTNSDGETSYDNVKVKLSYYDADEEKFCYRKADFGVDSDGELIKH